MSGQLACVGIGYALGNILTADVVCRRRHGVSAFDVGVGNPGMAKGGSGDVLAGILGGMLGQLPLKDAVCAGVCIHADAGDRCAAELGEYAMTPSDMIAAIPAVTKTMTGR